MNEQLAKKNRKMMRSIRLHFPNPDGSPREAPEPVLNFTDREDTRVQRRQKRFKPGQYAAELRESDPIAARARANFWTNVRIFLTTPGFREAVGNPHKIDKKGNRPST